MNWNPLTEVSQLDDIKLKSFSKPQIIFKHSLTCPISSIAKSRLSPEIDDQLADWHYLDLLNYREVSNAVADLFDVYHESPQVMIVHKGAVIFDDSHLDINASEITTQLSSLAQVSHDTEA